MGTIWQHMTVWLSDVNPAYEERVNTFFELMHWLMSHGHIKLVHNEIFLKGSIDDQLKRLRELWPSNPDENELDGIGMWFLATSPAWVVWIDFDGTECWT